MRTFFYSTESQASKSEVHSISAISDGAVPELVIAGAQLVSIEKEEGRVAILKMREGRG